MGQYFKIVNKSKGEYFSTRGLKAAEIVGLNNTLLYYLLFDSVQDGTGFTTSTSFDSRPRQGTDEYDQFLKEIRDSANKEIAEANEYAGRWANDDIAIVGDYASGNDEVLNHVSKERRKEIAEEFFRDGYQNPESVNFYHLANTGDIDDIGENARREMEDVFPFFTNNETKENDEVAIGGTK